MNAILNCLIVLFFALRRLRTVLVRAIRPVLIFVLVLTPAMAAAAALGGLANPIIDQAQGAVASWIATSVVSACAAVLTWIGSKIGIRVVERLNRATLQEAAERYANTIIDQIQVRYLASRDGLPDLSDLVLGGIGYVKAGNGGTVKSGKFTDSKIGDYVTGAINDRLVKTGGTPS